MRWLTHNNSAASRQNSLLSRWRRPGKPAIPILLILVSGCFSLLLWSCQKPAKPPPLTMTPGVLTVLTRNTPTVYYIGPDGEMGFEYDLVKALARHLKLKLRIKIAGSVSEILTAISVNQADIAAGGLTRTPERMEHFTFGPDYFTVRQEVVYRQGSPHPRNIPQLQDFTPLIPARSSYEERLLELKTEYPGLRWETTNDYSTDQLLEMVWRRRLSLTIADSNILAINRRYYPELRTAFPLSREQPLAWIINSQRRRLREKIFQWLEEFTRQGHLNELKERYYGHIKLFDYVDIKVFNRRIRTLLPTYRPWFEKYGRIYRIPWTLLAAKAYQESNWNPLATSPTGVRGIMMLTQATANELNVKDRLDPEESIRGGACYLRQLLNRVPGNYNRRDRWNVAMAAYNVGLGHIYDARQLARELGKNPDSWLTLKEVLPLLSQPRYYRKLKYGYARGIEPVRYVERVNNYREILEKQLEVEKTETAAGRVETSGSRF